MGFSRQECWSGLPFPSPGLSEHSPLNSDARLCSHLASPEGRAHGLYHTQPLQRPSGAHFLSSCPAAGTGLSAGAPRSSQLVGEKPNEAGWCHEFYIKALNKVLRGGRRNMNSAAWRKLDQWISRIAPSGKRTRAGGGILHEELHRKDGDSPLACLGNTHVDQC